MKHDATHLRFFRRLWLAMMALALGPMVCLTYAELGETERLVRRSADVELTSAAAAIASYTELWADGLLESLQELAMHPTIVGSSLDLPADHDAFEPPRVIPDDPRRAVLLHAIERRPTLKKLFIARVSDGQQIATSSDDNLRNVSDSRYFRAAIQGNTIIDVVSSNVDDAPHVVAAVPLKDALGKRVVGALVATADLDVVSARIAGITVDLPGHALVFDRDGNVAANPNRVRTHSGAGKEHPAVLQLRRNGGGVARFEERGRHVLAAVRETKHAWSVVVERDEEEALAPLVAAKTRTTKMLAIVAVIATLLSLVTSRRFAEALERLLAASSDIWAGTLRFEQNLLQGAYLARARLIRLLGVYAFAVAVLFFAYRAEDIGVPLMAFVAHAGYVALRAVTRSSRARRSAPPAPDDATGS